MELSLTRYNNRKLYNPETSRYFNFNEVRETLQRGVSVKVIDHTTRNDMTDKVLIEVLASYQRKNPPDRATILKLLGVDNANS
jgi:polyhydroxyalkanoate synthesis regulator protein